MMSLRRLLKSKKLFFNAARSYGVSASGAINVKINDKTGIATITMDRKPINGLTSKSLRDLTNAFKQLDGTARGAILTSSLPTVFTGGLDIMVLYKPQKENVIELWTELQETWITLHTTSYPTVAAINGHAPAGGCLLSMACEYRVMVDKYTIGMNETKLGLVAPFWVMSNMTKIIGARETERALTAGKLYTTQEAHKVGLVDEVATNKDDALVKAEAFFKNFEKVNPVARHLTKASLRKKMVDELRAKQKQDTEEFLVYVVQPEIQDVIEKYVQSLKKKSEK